jgi:metal-sulfur cluster biosynthetic enzyme
LKTCFDPEIPVNIVDLGLVYHCQAMPMPDGENRVEVKFTLTAPGCGMGGVLKADMERKILSLPGVTDVDVEVVFEPLWNQDMMSEAAKLELGLL